MASVLHPFLAVCPSLSRDDAYAQIDDHSTQTFRHRACIDCVSRLQSRTFVKALLEALRLGDIH